MQRERLPFTPGDWTAGSESELQVAVVGEAVEVDLPEMIRASAFADELLHRNSQSRELRKKLEQYLAGGEDRVWENSWVRFPKAALSPFTRWMMATDLLQDQQDPGKGPRSDRSRFFFTRAGEHWMRVPVSYSLKLALAEAIAALPDQAHPLRETAVRLLSHFLSDNTSPETTSFYVSRAKGTEGPGRAVAKEMAHRYLLTQLLAMYGNLRLGLKQHGQRAVVYMAPSPPQRQQMLNRLIPDALYRALFINPCLSGWREGEAKSLYMWLCHEVLSRSRVQARVRLREAGLGGSVALAPLSTTCLGNNGCHISLGSQRLTEAARAGELRPSEAKRLGDLAIKVTEHFLPLFVGLYSAAPQRFSAEEVTPENLLGFLPHQLGESHLRILWEQWSAKASGLPQAAERRWQPPWQRRPRKQGDWVIDARLLDYPVSLLSTNRQSALDGTLGNEERLKQDLSNLGIFDQRMPLYLLYRLRTREQHGFCGFEGRQYSLFESLIGDSSPATDLQTLITALAWDWSVSGKVTHQEIPDHPEIESERRQIIFVAAAGLTSFFVRERSENRLLQRIVRRCRSLQCSRDREGYLQVNLWEYQNALLTLLREEAPEWIEILGVSSTLDDLSDRITAPAEMSVAGKLTRRITGSPSELPSRIEAQTFNRAAEACYRGPLRQSHLKEAYHSFLTDWRQSDPAHRAHLAEAGEILPFPCPEKTLSWLEDQWPGLLREELDEASLLRLIWAVLLTIDLHLREAEEVSKPAVNQDLYAPVY